MGADCWLLAMPRGWTLADKKARAVPASTSKQSLEKSPRVPFSELPPFALYWRCCCIVSKALNGVNHLTKFVFWVHAWPVHSIKAGNTGQ